MSLRLTHVRTLIVTKQITLELEYGYAILQLSKSDI